MAQETRQLWYQLLLCGVLLAVASTGPAQEFPTETRGVSADSVYAVSETGIINLFDRNLTLPISIGQSYPVSPQLSLGMQLVYNAHVWDVYTEYSQPDDYPSCYSWNSTFGWEAVPVDLPVPSTLFNSGLGWLMSLGQLYMPNEPPFDTAEKKRWLYVDPGGASHGFRSVLHSVDEENEPGEDKVWYTGDGSLLRMREAQYPDCSEPIDCRLIELPDGTVHEFVDLGGTPRFRLVQIRDRFGNTIDISYDFEPTAVDGDKPSWTISDGHRTQIIQFADFSDDPDNPFRFLQMVRLTGFNESGNPAIYQLEYESRDLHREGYGLLTLHCGPEDCPGCGDPPDPGLVPEFQGVLYPYEDDPATPDVDESAVSVHLLTKVVQPDGTFFSMDYDDHGRLSTIRLPSGLYLSYDYERRPSPGAQIWPDDKRKRRKFATWGVGRKWLFSEQPPEDIPGAAAGCNSEYPELITADEALCICNALADCSSVWSYDLTTIADHGVGGQGHCAERSMVTLPDGSTEVSYFNTWAEGPWYGLPYTTCDPHDGDLYDHSISGPFLSKEIRDTNESVLRSTYVDYFVEWVDGLADSWSIGGVDESEIYDKRLVTEQTLFQRSNGEQYSLYKRAWEDVGGNRVYDYDGVGHYRKWTTSADFPYSATNATSYTSYNPGAGATYRPGPEQPWVLNTFDSSVETYGPFSATTQHCFDSETGFLKASRRLAGSSPGSNDLLVRFEDLHGDGFVYRESYFGGDGGNLAAGNLCNVADSLNWTEADYVKEHDYDHGSLSWSAFVNCNGNPIHQLASNVIDAATGLVRTSTAQDKFSVTYDYDLMGRLWWVKPLKGAVTKYVYHQPTESDPNAVLQLRQMVCSEGTNAGSCTPASQSTLTWTESTYDRRGQMVKQERWMPTVAGDGSINRINVNRTFAYDEKGRLTAESEWRASGGTLFQTTYADFDRFDRPRTITRPDGSVMATSWEDSGTWKKTSSVQVQTLSGLETSVVDSWYDMSSNLVRLNESIDSLSSIASSYRYDQAGRVVKACVNDLDAAVGVPLCWSTGGPDPSTQVRVFEYDGRGLLTFENHPEIGGGLSYTYNALGNLSSRRGASGLADLDYRFDGAGRPVQVLHGGDLLTEYFYDRSMTSPRPASAGKLVRQKQHNKVPTPESPDDLARITITEELDYDSVTKRLAGRSLLASNGRGFNLQINSWDDLGNITALSYPSCFTPSCTGTPAASSRTVDYSYSNSLLTGVSSGATVYLSAIGYHPDAALAQLDHGNGVSDVRVRSASQWSPLQRISFKTGATDIWSSGDYAYDPAGRITQIGSETYRYDHLGRLTQGRVNPRDGGGLSGHLFEHDPYGNIKRITFDDSSYRDLTTSTQTNRLAAATYDALGRVKQHQQTSLEYNTLDHVTEVVNGPGLGRSYLYTADGERVAIFDLDAGTEEWTIRGFDNEVLSRLVFDGATWSRDKDYIHAGDLQVAAESSSGLRHFHLDHLNTTRVVTDGNGGIFSQLTYYPFGEEAGRQGGEPDQLQFTGHERDSGFNLDYMHARYYRPTIGRFLSLDPVGGEVGSSQSWNRYNYALNNPIELLDSDGQYAIFYLLNYAFTHSRASRRASVQPRGLDQNRVVSANNNTDIFRLFGRGDLGEHLNTGNGRTASAEDTRVVAAMERLEMAVNDYANNDTDSAADNFGSAQHMLQDVIGHGGVNQDQHYAGLGSIDSGFSPGAAVRALWGTILTSEVNAAWNRAITAIDNGENIETAIERMQQEVVAETESIYNESVEGQAEENSLREGY